jgi:hypothetical protein
VEVNTSRNYHNINNLLTHSCHVEHKGKMNGPFKSGIYRVEGTEIVKLLLFGWGSNSAHSARPLGILYDGGPLEKLVCWGTQTVRDFTRPETKGKKKKI